MLRNRRLRGRAEPGAPAPFVVGVGRSGTTLLRMMLDAHPELAIPPETHFVNPLIQASGRIRFTRRDRLPGRSSTTSADAGTTSASTRASCWRASRRSSRSTPPTPCAPSTALYADKHGKSRWGDKTPDYVRKMKKIQKTLPEARFIHVIRDGRDAGLSQNARMIKRGKPVPPREMARRWRKRIIKSREDAAAISAEDYLEVRYEDLVADTEVVLRRVCELVELDYDPVMLRYHERASERLQEMAGALPANQGRPEREAGERVAAHEMTTKPPDPERLAVWKREMSESENAEFEEAAGLPARRAGLRDREPARGLDPARGVGAAKDRSPAASAAAAGPAAGQLSGYPQPLARAFPLPR